MGKDLAKDSWERTSNCFWWGCLVLSQVVEGTGFAHWRVYRPAHPAFPAGLGRTWCLSWKLEIWTKRAFSCFACPAIRWVLPCLRNFPKGLHSSDILAESSPELKALSPITCLGLESQPPAPVATPYLSMLYLSPFTLASGDGELCQAGAAMKREPQHPAWGRLWAPLPRKQLKIMLLWIDKFSTGFGLSGTSWCVAEL